MSTIHQRRAATAFILSEASGSRSRGAGVIAPSQDFDAGQVLGRIANASGVTVSAVADPGNTAGSGALTLASPAYSSRVKEGVYAVTMETVVANGGKFRVEDPAGVHVGDASVGTAFNKEVKFTIADANDFVIGDKFTIKVEFGPGGTLYKAWKEDATDGSEIAAAIAIYPVKTDGSTTQAVAIFERDGEVNGKELDFSATASGAQIDAAIDQLAQVGIIVR
jgi:hypothetical protein